MAAPRVWGPPMWELLHLITIKPNQPMTVYQMFFDSIRYLLPCKKCQRNYTEHVSMLPIPHTKKELASWLIAVHNRVNQSIDKPTVNAPEMLTHWQQRYKQVSSLATILIPPLYYIIHHHPGYYKITPEYEKAHQQFWTYIPLFFSHFPDTLLIKNYLTQHPPPILYKEKYKQWFKQFQKQFLPKQRYQSIHCDNVCRI
jgi:hypothetical protein